MPKDDEAKRGQKSLFLINSFSPFLRFLSSISSVSTTHSLAVKPGHAHHNVHDVHDINVVHVVNCTCTHSSAVCLHLASNSCQSLLHRPSSRFLVLPSCKHPRPIYEPIHLAISFGPLCSVPCVYSGIKSHKKPQFKASTYVPRETTDEKYLPVPKRLPAFLMFLMTIAAQVRLPVLPWPVFFSASDHSRGPASGRGAALIRHTVGSAVEGGSGRNSTRPPLPLHVCGGCLPVRCKCIVCLFYLPFRLGFREGAERNKKGNKKDTKDS